MKFIQALRLKNKLLFLFILITLGLTFVAIVGAMNLSSMKKKLDSLYFGSFITILELDNIINAYHIQLQDSVYLVKVSKETTEYAKKIDIAVKTIETNWEKYKNQYKTKEEIPYVLYATKEIDASIKQLQELQQLVANKQIQKISLKKFVAHLNHMDGVVFKLRNYEIENAEFQRKELLETYNDTKVKLGFLLFLIIGGVLLILLLVFKSIQQDQSELEIASRKLKAANKKLQEASYMDPLTQIHNRRYFNIIFEREIKRAKRTKSFITFMMLDVDYFKQYNDTYGHIEGDNALKTVASTLSSLFKRPTDYIFRLGGEEFGVLTTNVDSSNSALLAQKICDVIQAKKVPHSESKVSEHLSISVGVVNCIADETLREEDMIRQADKMLYEAKESGRNRYILSDSLIASN